MLNTFNPADLIVVSPLVILFIVSLIPISVKAFRGREMSPFVSLVWSIVGIVSAAGLNISLVSGYWKLSGLNFITAFSGGLVVDGISVWAAYVLYIIAGFVLMQLYENKATRDFQFSEHIFLILNSVIGMILVTMANHLLITFIAIELMSLSIYLLIALSKEQVLSKEAAFKYFVLGAVGSAIFLYGVAFVFGAAGTVGLQEIGAKSAELFMTNKIFILGVGLLVAGMAFKVSLMPFHAWAPDVYQGSATPVTTLMATGVKLACFVAFLRLFLYADAVEKTNLTYVLQWLAVITIIGGSLAALRQENLKRMLAYSSIAHSGYALLGLIAATLGATSEEGTTSLLFYLLTYILMTIGSFSIISSLESKADSMLLIDDIKGLAKRSPLVAFSFSVLLLSLAGLPPTLGFFGKFYLIASVMNQGFYWLGAMAMLGSAIGVYFYLRPIVTMYMSEGGTLIASNKAYLTQAIALVMALTMILFGVFSSPLFSFVRNAVFYSL
jgi:NADH-quinone oxidoreductase subunit N